MWRSGSHQIYKGFPISSICYYFIFIFTFVWLFFSAFGIILSIGPSSGFPNGIPIDANYNFPCMLCNSLTVATVFLLISVKIFMSLLHLSGGNCIVFSIPSSNQPNISFCVSHAPSSSSFLGEIGSPMMLPVSSAVGKALVIACSMHLVSLCSSVLSVHWINARKSSFSTPLNLFISISIFNFGIVSLIIITVLLSMTPHHVELSHFFSQILFILKSMHIASRSLFLRVVVFVFRLPNNISFYYFFSLERLDGFLCPIVKGIHSGFINHAIP